jgi:L-lactate dehydrogenase complex protein LldG
MSRATSSREVILGRIRGDISSVENASPESEFALLPRTYQESGKLDEEACLRMFIERLHEYDAHVVETTPAQLASTIASVLELRRQSNVIVADGFPRETLPAGRSFRWEHEVTRDQLERTDGVITGCCAAIALTGSIVLRHGPGEGARQFTLLPDRHLCVVHAGDVVETVPEAIARLGPYTKSPITFISGPSATADIEMTRIRGVHGPRFLDVVLVRS